MCENDRCVTSMFIIKHQHLLEKNITKPKRPRLVNFLSKNLDKEKTTNSDKGITKSFLKKGD